MKNKGGVFREGVLGVLSTDIHHPPQKKERKKSFSAIFSNEIVFSENDSEIAVSVLKTFSENLLRSNNALRPCYNIPKTF